DGDALVEEYKALKARPPVEDADGVDGGAAGAVGAAGEAESAPAGSDARLASASREPAFVTAPRRYGRSRAKRRRGRPGPGVYFVRRLAVALVIILPLAG